MKLHFESDLDYQRQAINAVVDLFRGQETCRTEFTVITTKPAEFFGGETESESVGGIGNRLSLLDDEILKNLQAVQLRNGLPLSKKLDGGDFTVEMETGTGKTYVYLRTIFELNREYGFNKFVIVVPSVAIKEGVYKTLQMTDEHLRSLYANAPYEYFLYDSSKLGQVKNFATSAAIQIMVITVGAINKRDVNNLYKDTEKTGGDKPIDLIKATRPIIIVDEPQSVDGGLTGKGKEALDAMKPLCTLRYSATHANTHHMVYRLDAVDAYEQKLVKQIEVASLTVQSGHNKPYVRFISAKQKGGTVVAKLELDVQQAKSAGRKIVEVHGGDDLAQVTKRDMYENIIVNNIGSKEGAEFLELSNHPSRLRLGEAIGDVDDDAFKRLMIKRTILEHLEKEKRLRRQGIKVLSLFFIDRVEHYRTYDAAGNAQKGKYAVMFEEEYTRAAGDASYQTLFKEVDLKSSAGDVHNGYFSIDKKGGWTDTEDSNQGGRDNAERAYNLIMKEKEKLLSFETPLKFIFSHSALREGWDNPNVFQICALREMGTERERRQTIGRGLRLCVNQKGDRLRGFDVNTLTVIATESYEDFAENLQKEIEKDTGIRFGVVEQHQFANLAVMDEAGVTKQIGPEKSADLWAYFRKQEYLDKNGKVQDVLRTALKDDKLSIPQEFKDFAAPITDWLKKLAGKLEIKNADQRKVIATRQAILESEEFRALWDRIKQKTTYRVEFDNEKLIVDCSKAIENMNPIPKTRVHIRKAGLAIGRGGIQAKEEQGSETAALHERDIVLPDLLTDLEFKTQLTRRSLVRILKESKRLKHFPDNPQRFIEQANEAINQTKQHALVAGIKYQKVGAEEYWAQELFGAQELTGYLNTVVSTKSPFQHVVYDSGIEKDFATELENNGAVKVYAKLPGKFTVPTPLGSYNPDWAVLIEENGTERLYFVVETKGTPAGAGNALFASELRGKEAGKIACGKEHFAALAQGIENPVKFIQAKDLDDVLAHA